MSSTSRTYLSSITRPVVLLFAIAPLLSCSGGSGGGANAPSSDPAQPSVGGTLYATNGVVSQSLGLSYAISVDSGISGISSFVRERRDDESQYRSGAEFLVGTSRLSPQIMYGVNECEEYVPPRGFTELRSCIEVASAADQRERLLTLETEISKPPVMSPDGSMFVVEVQQNHDLFSDRLLRLYTASGDLLDEVRSSRRQAGNTRYDWTPDNRVVYGIQNTDAGAFLVMAPAGSLQIENAFRISASEDARVGKIAVSPDGASIAYDLVDPDVTPYRALVLDIATGEAISVADTPADMAVGRPTWSPDGTYLVVLHGDDQAISESKVFGGEYPSLMLIAWRGETTYLDVFEGIGTDIKVQHSDAHPLGELPASFSFNDNPRSGRQKWYYDTQFVWAD